MLVHHPDSEHRLMAVMTVCFADESEYHLTPSTYVVSGLLGNAVEWYDLGIRWRRALKDKGLEAYGFHMSQCENGSEPPYNRMERPERYALQRTFIDIIQRSNLWGRATGIAQGRYNEADVKDAARAELGSVHKPYYFCFNHTIQWIANEVEEAGEFPREERVAFIFDRQQEYQGNAKALYDEVLTQHIENKHRLGHLGFDERMNAVQLQAADVWAYESQRFLRATMLGETKCRWQFTRLAGDDSATSRYRVKFLSSDGVETLARGRGWIP